VSATVVPLNFFTKTWLTNNYFWRDPHFVLLAWVQSWNTFEQLMKLWSPPDFFHKIMSHEQLPFVWSALWKNSGGLHTFISFSKIFNFVPTLESRNVDHVRSNCSWECFSDKIQADCTLSWVFQKYFNIVPILESPNVDHMKGNCSWGMFLWKNSDGLHSFMSFSKTFQLCTHARITKSGSREN